MDFTSLLHLTPLQVVAVYALFMVGSSAVRAMPEPTAGAGMFYRWLYGFAHGLGANWGHVKEAIHPELPIPQAKK